MMAAAVFLLLFTAVDLAFPAACGEEQGSYATIQLVSLLQPDAGSLGLQREAPQNAQPSMDDCFCCCSHLLACRPFVLAVVASAVGSPERLAISAPSPSIQTAYDPPRLS